RAREVLSHVFLPNIDQESIPEMLALTAKAPDFFFPMMGLHPSHVKADYKEVLAGIEAEWDKGTYYGVGETGLDFYWDKTYVTEQKASLRLHIEWAKAKQLPLILHCRESMEEVIELVSEGQDGRLRGIFHCFTRTREQAAQIHDLGFVMGIGGVLTYKNSGLPETLKEVPLEHLVLETDSPYLPPVPYRGKRNESSYIPKIARKLAEVKDLPIAEIDKITSENALKIFAIPPDSK
ncbi:MAG TPA: TatD family deoxyribonuclease, partial [Bacteroidetes bacterium]|nr:TatD family deoxyribonuclease [Bacteroidota bacterium]